MRGTFGLGGKMAVLYGQITTHQPAFVTSSHWYRKIYQFKLMMDIQTQQTYSARSEGTNKQGTMARNHREFTLEGDYLRAMPKIIEYFKTNRHG